MDEAYEECYYMGYEEGLDSLMGKYKSVYSGGAEGEDDDE